MMEHIFGDKKILTVTDCKWVGLLLLLIAREGLLDLCCDDARLYMNGHFAAKVIVFLEIENQNCGTSN